MALPSNVGMGTVTFNIQELDGDAGAGTVTFTPEIDLIRNTGAGQAALILTIPTVVEYTAGTGSVQLIATNDTDNQPLGWTYSVTIKPDGGYALEPFSIQVIEGQTVNLANLITF